MAFPGQNRSHLPLEALGEDPFPASCSFWWLLTLPGLQQFPPMSACVVTLPFLCVSSLLLPPSYKETCASTWIIQNTPSISEWVNQSHLQILLPTEANICRFQELVSQISGAIISLLCMPSSFLYPSPISF